MERISGSVGGTGLPGAVGESGGFSGTITIGPERYTVRPSTSIDDAEARIYYSRGEIKYAEHLAPDRLRVDLCHEITHAWIESLRLEDKAEEDICEVVSRGMVMFLRDNPEFVKWIQLRS